MNDDPILKLIRVAMYVILILIILVIMPKKCGIQVSIISKPNTDIEEVKP